MVQQVADQAERLVGLIGDDPEELQRDAMRAAGVDDAVNLYHDLASGVRDDRPGLDSCPRPNLRCSSTSRVSNSTSQTPPRGRPPTAAATGLATTDHCGRTSEAAMLLSPLPVTSAA